MFSVYVLGSERYQSSSAKTCSDTLCVPISLILFFNVTLSVLRCSSCEREISLVGVYGLLCVMFSRSVKFKEALADLLAETITVRLLHTMVNGVCVFVPGPHTVFS